MSTGTAPQETSRHARQSPAPRSGSGGRDHYFDNAKLLLMVVVVFGHSLALAPGTRAVQTVYMTVYAFHMPAFLIISGYFSRSFDAAPRRVQRLVAAMLVPYVLFQTVYSALQNRIGDHPYAWNLLYPTYMLWFLPALFLWRLSTPVWQRLRWPVATAVLLSLVCGLEKAPFLLAVIKVLTMAPFFVLGLRLRREHFAVLHRLPVRIASVLLFAVTGVGFWLLHDQVDRNWVLWSDSYHQLGTSALVGAASRLGMIVLGVALSAAFFSLVPVGRTFFTRLGAATMTVFLLHGFVFMPFWARPHWAGLHLRSSVALLLLAALAVVLTLLLSLPWVNKVTRPLTEPRCDWLFRKDTES
ncbi:acyltransferase family protein [Peterkaempfera sp. SMS 1(5)a]|uniref:acyltransferase family protein n=1 Tax=Peterkaempfera podocarpi TaxID=3232308 RepID=UPI0036706F55